MLVGPPGHCPACPCVKMALDVDQHGNETPFLTSETEDQLSITTRMKYSIEQNSHIMNAAD